MLDTLSPTDPILLLAIVDGKLTDLPRDVRAWFGSSKENRVPWLTLHPKPARRSSNHSCRTTNAFPDGMKRRKRVLEVLPVAPPVELA